MRHLYSSISIRMAVCLTAAFLFRSALAPAQQPASDAEVKVASGDQPQEKRRPAQFRAEVDQVVVYSTVHDKEGHLVSNLTQEDFSVFEDKVQQEVTYFGVGDIPSTVGIVIDSSGSMRNKFDLVNQAVRLFLSINNPENELFLIAFKDQVKLEQEFTRDVYDIYDALDNIIVSGGTALYDAIYLAVDQCREGSEPKKTVVVFTDGEDKDSYYSHEELIEKVRESDVQVYVVAFLDKELSNTGGFFGIFKSDRQKVQGKISLIADYTGGKAFFPEEIQQLNDIFQSIASELRQQYRLAYLSTNPVKDGSWRAIDVVIKDAKQRDLKVRAKRGYFAR